MAKTEEQTIPEVHSKEQCKKHLMPVRDALYVISGKWKLPIIIALRFGNKRFKELQREISDITPKMLSKELKELEMNKLVKRTVYDTTPVTVEYELTNYGLTLDELTKVLYEWGTKHRERIMSD